MTGTALLDVDELRTYLNSVTLLDIRWRLGGPPGLDEFRDGHLSGARFIDLEADLASAPGPGGRHPLPDPDHFAAAMRRAGVSNDAPVVVYDDSFGQTAARAWWLLRHYGHNNVRLLDGGLAAWRTTGATLSVGDAPPGQPGDFRSRAGAMPVVEAHALAALDVLIDARAPVRYRGEVEPIDPVAGHIPGAVNVPTSRNLDDRGYFPPATELAHTYAEAGVTPGTRVAAYCGSGVTAAHDVLAMEVAGISAALFPGSWSEWITDGRRPVAGMA